MTQSSPSERGVLASMRVEHGITVAHLLVEPRLQAILRLVAGEEGRDRPVDHPRVQKPGLALAGHTHGVVPTRVQILGETELTFLEELSPEEQRQGVSALFGLGLSLVVVTRGVDPPAVLLEAAQKTSTPLVVAEPRSSRAIQTIHRVLDTILAPSETRHGVLMDVHGVGTLLLGPSGIGKSECALFLVERGHRFVADDQVVLSLLPPEQILGRAPPLLRNHLEVRGIGIINVRDLFGATAVRSEKTLQLVVELCPWSNDEPFDRLGLDDSMLDILGVPVPMLRIPVRPGRNMAVILEVAARNHILKAAGHHGAQKFIDTLMGDVDEPDSGLER
ncbi:MAG: HPr(Ser) kinase/phosphatase [Deltaproteobacteria bacterium]|nr:HPr(Ser) kinase/phosphatase [Deltaproteobacteria bacterium]